MITIADHTLSRLVAQTKPHMAGRTEMEAVQVIVLDYDGSHLYAWATNRFTLALSRTQASGDDKPWTAIIGRHQVQELEAAIRLLDSKPVNLERTDGQLLLSGESGSRIAIDLRDSKEPFDWRKVVLPALERKSAPEPMSLAPKFFAAWKNLPHPVQMWSTGEGKPGLIVAADFLGLQMPIRRTADEETGLQRELDSWKPAQPAELPAAA